jgi:pseudouridine-5'-phosphate glycosidase
MTVPIPLEAELDRNEVEEWLKEALADAENQGISGKEITPFLLAEMSRYSDGRTLAANIALLENNTRVAAQISFEISTSN